MKQTLRFLNTLLNSLVQNTNFKDEQQYPNFTAWKTEKKNYASSVSSKLEYWLYGSEIEVYC